MLAAVLVERDIASTCSSEPEVPDSVPEAEKGSVSSILSKLTEGTV